MDGLAERACFVWGVSLHYADTFSRPEVNLAENDQDLSITFYFDGGHYKLPVHLKANASAMFNASDIIMMQQPDAEGNNIPRGTLHGTAVLSAASADPEWINVGVSVGIFNVSTATRLGRCPHCPTYNDFKVLPYLCSARFLKELFSTSSRSGRHSARPHLHLFPRRWNIYAAPLWLRRIPKRRQSPRKV